MAFSTRIDDAVVSEFLAKARKLSPQGFAPEFAQLGRVLRQKVIAGFDAERDPYGTPWMPLARRTQRYKEKRGYPPDILVATGQLKRSFHYRVLVNGVRLFSDRVFSDGVGAEIHQYGGTSKTGNAIPARPMLPDKDAFPPDWMEEVERLVGDGLDRIFN